jgi:anhydro-N-acetylmuramic acid kinase
MVYRALGLMSGSSLDGLDLAFAEFEVTGNRWSYQVLAADCYSYSDEWMEQLRTATQLPAREYMQLHANYGRLLGSLVNSFVEAHQLQYKIQLIGSHGHTTFHSPATGLTHQLGDGATLAAATGINVVSDLRNLDVALGGQGAPIVPIGEKWLLHQYQYFLNIGGIANLSSNSNPYVAFDVCAANRVLNLLVQPTGKAYDEGGQLARTGQVNNSLLQDLNALAYYQQPFPKSLANEFGTDVVYPLIKHKGLPLADELCTYTEHIAHQLNKALQQVPVVTIGNRPQLLATGGGAFNTFLVERMQALNPEVDIVVPDAQLVNYKEALIMGFIAVLRWREEPNALTSVTGAERDSVGGAIWSGQAW